MINWDSSETLMRPYWLELTVNMFVAGLLCCTVSIVGWVVWEAVKYDKKKAEGQR